MPTSEELRFDLRDALADADVAAAVAQRLQADEGFVVAMTRDLGRHERRAVYVPGTFSVDRVDFGEGGLVRIAYSYDWETHFACREEHFHERGADSISGRVHGGELVLTILQLEKRSTADEL